MDENENFAVSFQVVLERILNFDKIDPRESIHKSSTLDVVREFYFDHWSDRKLKFSYTIEPSPANALARNSVYIVDGGCGG